MNGGETESTVGSGWPATNDESTARPVPVSIVRRRPGDNPGHRAIHALQPARWLLLGGMIISLLASALVGVALVTNAQPPMALWVLASMTIPLAVGAHTFSRMPLRVNKWTLYGALLALGMFASWLMLLGTDSFDWRLVYMALGMVAWIREIPLLEHKAILAVRNYEAEGGRIEDLYGTARPEDRRLVNPTAAVIMVLVILMGAALIWSAGSSMADARSRAGVIGIGGGR